MVWLWYATESPYGKAWPSYGKTESALESWPVMVCKANIERIRTRQTNECKEILRV